MYVCTAASLPRYIHINIHFLKLHLWVTDFMQKPVDIPGGIVNIYHTCGTKPKTVLSEQQKGNQPAAYV